jgi:uncharacterized cupredoxin-like copper-binding protein
MPEVRGTSQDRMCSHRRKEIAMRALVSLVAIAAAATIGVAAAGAVTSGKTVGVKLDEFNVLLAKQAAPAGKVTFVVKNVGKMAHEFVVLKTAKPAGDLLSHGGEASEAGNVGEIAKVKPGETKKLTLTLKKGHYSLLCNYPGHYKAGQFVDFYVR